MSATLSPEPRRTSPQSAGPNRELPVLFHLMDVGRLKSPSPAPVIAPSVEPSSQSEFAAVPREPAISAPEPLPTAELPSSSTAMESPAYENPSVPVASLPTSDAVETSATEVTCAPATVPEPEASVQAAASEAIEKAPIAAKATATPRKDSERRQAKSKAQRGNEWFANQGRYIAIGFVLALIGTIFIARSNRGTAPTVAVQPHADPGEAGQQVAASEIKPATIVGESPEKPTTETTTGKTSEASPANLADATAAEKTPQADLHPPTIPQLVREPAPSNQPDNNALFPWTEQPGDRLATRPDAPAVAPTQYPVTAAGSPSPSYPITATPNSSLTGPPQQQPAVPPDYRSPYIPAAPANSQPPSLGQSFVPPAGGPGPTYLPSDNTARGYRYERTGSGPY
jgi:hypothetical protein